MPASSHEIVDALAKALNAVAPDDCEVSASDGLLRVVTAGTTALTIDMSDQDWYRHGVQFDDASLFEGDMRGALSAVQDAFSVHTSQPWPYSAASFALPGARLQGQQLRVWFGDEEDPAIRLPEIGLSARPGD